MNKLRLVLDRVLLLAIFIVAIATVHYSSDLATGALEPEWAYDGVTFSSHNIMMLFLFGLSGGGVIYLFYKLVKNSFLRIFGGVFGALIAALLMASSSYLYGMVPLMVVLFVIGVALNERKKLRRESNG